MEDVLAGIRAGVHQQPVPGLRDASLRRHPGRRQGQVAHQLPVLGGHRVIRRDVLEGNEEHVHRCLGIDVLEGDAPVISHHELRGDLPIPDLAEHAVGHGGNSARAPRAMTTPTGLTRRGIVVEATTRDTRGAALGRARWLLLAVLLPLPVLAEARTYRVAPPSEGSKAEAVVVYSLGTHTVTAQDVRGEVTLDPTTLASGSGTVVVPLAGLHGDGGTRD